jgi:hypothetical protein
MTAKKETTTKRGQTSMPKVKVQDLPACPKELTEEDARSPQGGVDAVQAQKIKGGLKLVKIDY